MTTPPRRVPPLVPDSRRRTSRTSSRPGCQRRGIRTHGCPGAQPSCLRGGPAAPIGSMASDGLVIVGASLAGAKAAEGARDGGWAGAIRLAGAEWHLPYERPPLSKGVMQGSEQPSVARVHDDGFYAGHEIEILLGASWIGTEVAASARQRGTEVVMVDPLSQPLERVLGPEVGRYFARLHTDHGAKLRLGTGVEAFAGDGRVEAVRLSDGSAVDADAVMVGIGVNPNVDLARSAGLAVDQGG